MERLKFLRTGVLMVFMMLASSSVVCAQRPGGVAPTEVPVRALEEARTCGGEAPFDELAVTQLRGTLAAQARRLRRGPAAGTLVTPIECDAGGPSRLLLVVTRGEFVQVLSDHNVNMWSAFELRGIHFEDVNRDGRADLIVAATAISGVGEDGATPFLLVDCWLGSPAGWFRDRRASGRLWGRRVSTARAIELLREHFGAR